VKVQEGQFEQQKVNLASVLGTIFVRKKTLKVAKDVVLSIS
jgi:hypothetical protein